YMIKQTTHGAVSPSTGRTLPDRYIEGECPICHYASARGDQCDNCGNQLDPEELINPRSRINGETPVFVETEHFFLDLPAPADARQYYFMGKDNITFHSQIWPAELLAYNGEGSRGGQPGEYGTLALPTEVVSSEFLTMEGRKFSSSRSVVIYVRDFLSRYDADSLRYYLSANGPENSDTDFTWAEFVRRNNDELVAAWGNLVNRSLSFTAKNIGE